MSAPSSSAQPRLSATILLLRDNTELEVLMVARHYQIDFASGALVFPGGKANPEDADPNWDGFIDGSASGEQRTAQIAAIREAFEESGLLMARPRSARGVRNALVGAETAQAMAPMRAQVDRREVNFLDLIKAHDLVLALDVLIHFGHWITPEIMPKRFDTHFYLAPAPANQIASHDGRETTDAVWLNPQKALEMEASGQATIIFPTRMNLKKLMPAKTLETARARFEGMPVVTVLPMAGKAEDGTPCLHIPEEAGYGQTVEPLDRIRA